MFIVLMEGMEVGGHWVGGGRVMCVNIPLFTTRNITLQGTNHNLSLTLAVWCSGSNHVTQTILTTFQLIYSYSMFFSVYVYYLCTCLEPRVCVVYEFRAIAVDCPTVIYLMLFGLPLSSRIPPHPDSSHSPLSLVLMQFSAECSLQMSPILLSLLAVLQIIPKALVVFSARSEWFWYLAGQRFLKFLGNVSTPQNRQHLSSTWFGHPKHLWWFGQVDRPLQ